jgi:probable HAF family extracellular repeat protein
MLNRTSALSVVACLLAFLGPRYAVADDANPSFKFTQVSVPGAVSTVANGINNAGVIVGSYQDLNNAFHGYILDGSNLTVLDDPNGTDTTASDLNPNGTISVVGEYKNSAGHFVGFKYQDGVYTDIPGPPGAISSAANDINDSGVIVGSYTDANNSTRAFMLKDGNYTTLGVDMAIVTIASGVNNKGYVTVWSVDGLSGITQSRAYNYRTGTYQLINVPDATDSLALDINDAGDVSYQWTDSNLLSHGAVLHEGTYYKFDYPGAASTFAQGINGNLQVVGGYEAVANGPFSGFEALR